MPEVVTHAPEAAVESNGAAKPVKAKRASKPKAKKPSTDVKRTSNYRADGGLTKMHVRILTAMSKWTTPASVERIAKAIDVDEKNQKTVRWAIGSIKPDNRDPLSLLARGHLKQVEAPVDGGKGKEHLYEATKSGLKAIE